MRTWTGLCGFYFLAELQHLRSQFSISIRTRAAVRERFDVQKLPRKRLGLPEAHAASDKYPFLIPTCVFLARNTSLCVPRTRINTRKNLRTELCLAFTQRSPRRSENFVRSPSRISQVSLSRRGNSLSRR